MNDSHRGRGELLSVLCRNPANDQWGASWSYFIRVSQAHDRAEVHEENGPI